MNCRIAVLAHFADGTERFNGQTVRSRLVRSELIKRLGSAAVTAVDTGDLGKTPVQTVRALRNALRTCSDAVIMPGGRGLQWLLPLYLWLQRRSSFRIHYLVVGGWLPGFLAQRPRLRRRVAALEGVYVQTRRMVKELEVMGLSNTRLLPNFRDFPKEPPRSQGIGDPMRLVFLSRVTPSKGVALAVEAVSSINRSSQTTRCTLDVWGPVHKRDERWFDALKAGFTPDIQYSGVAQPEDIPQLLAGYDILLFPTYYPGEGFPGVILDAFISGVAVIASDWQDNQEFVEHGVNGFIFQDRDQLDLEAKISTALNDPSTVVAMKARSAGRASQFHVDKVIPKLLSDLQLAEKPHSSTELVH